MNRIEQRYVAIPKTIRARNRSASSAVLVLCGLGLTMPALALDAGALPTNGQLSAGSATVSTAGSAMTITQNSGRAALNWTSFNIGSQASVTFVQPGRGAIALNRVQGSDPSRIFGSLRANGQVFLINPNGVLFGSSAEVDVGGLVASTLKLSDNDFMAGRRSFSAGGGSGSVVNQGRLHAADGGYVALLGAQVSNDGTIAAQLGTVALGAGGQVTLDFAGDRLLSLAVERSAIDALAQNRMLIKADGGQVLLSAAATGALLQNVVNNDGVIEARTLHSQNGVIRLLGSFDGGTVRVGGTLDASAPAGGDGGAIDTSGAHVAVADGVRISTAAPHGRTGNWLIDPADFTIAAAGGDISGATLAGSLAASNVTILSSAGGSGVDGNINVNDTVSWSANTLTLNAHNDINIHTAMHGSGTASLALEYGQGAPAAGNTSAINLQARVDLPAGAHYSTRQGSDGATVAYTVIDSLGAQGSASGADLQGMAANPGGNYVLGADIDASATSGWNGGAGFAPIENFNGRFDGLGHTISGLTINLPVSTNVGLFGDIGGNASVRNVGVVNAAITGRLHTGILAGMNAGSISNAYTTGTVHGTYQMTGGLAGRNSGSIGNAYSAATVIGDSSTTGGLVGFSYGSIANAYSTGAVSGTFETGGLVGWNTGGISYAYSTGTVNGSANASKLVGSNSGGGTISNSFWKSGNPGTASGTAGTALSAAQFKQAGTFADAGWDIASQGGSSAVWRIYEGQTAPLLRSFLTPLTIAGTTVTYNGATQAGKTAGTTSASSDIAASGRNVGTYAYSGYSSQQGYDISGGSLTITQASLTISTSDVTKTYDGTTSAAGKATVIGGTLFGGDSLSGGSYAFTDPDIGTNKTVTVGDVTVSDGNGGANYAVTYASNTSSAITAADTRHDTPVDPIVIIDPIVTIDPVIITDPYLPVTAVLAPSGYHAAIFSAHNQPEVAFATDEVATANPSKNRAAPQSDGLPLTIIGTGIALPPGMATALPDKTSTVQ